MSEIEIMKEEEEERYCDNKNCPYGSYICFEELEKYSGKDWVCEKCSKEEVSDDEEEEDYDDERSKAFRRAMKEKFKEWFNNEINDEAFDGVVGEWCQKN